MQRLEKQVAAAEGRSAPDCCSSSGVELRRAGVAGTGGAVPLLFSSGRDAGAAAARAAAAAGKEAARNADAGNPSAYQTKQVRAVRLGEGVGWLATLTSAAQH
jgi:hypothetical protein